MNSLIKALTVDKRSKSFDSTSFAKANNLNSPSSTVKSHSSLQNNKSHLEIPLIQIDQSGLSKSYDNGLNIDPSLKKKKKVQVIYELGKKDKKQNMLAQSQQARRSSIILFYL